MTLDTSKINRFYRAKHDFINNYSRNNLITDILQEVFTE